MAGSSVSRTHKICRKCGETKAIEDFTPDARMRDGHRNECRVCRATRERLRLRSNPEQHRAYMRQQRKKYPERYKQYDRMKHERHHAHIIEAAHQRYNRDKDLINARRREKNAINPEPHRERERERRLRNGAHVRALERANKLKHRAKRLTQQRLNRQKYPERYQEYDQRKRAKRKNVLIRDLSKQDWQDILAAFDHRCAYCGRKMQRLTQDHITPLSKGGNHTKSNVVPACQSCNNKKYTGPPLKPVQPLLL